VAEEVRGKSAKKYQQAYWTKNPKAKRWKSRDKITYFKVAPRWIHYSDLNKNPWDVFETPFLKNN